MAMLVSGRVTCPKNKDRSEFCPHFFRCLLFTRRIRLRWNSFEVRDRWAATPTTGGGLQWTQLEGSSKYTHILQYIYMCMYLNVKINVYRHMNIYIPFFSSYSWEGMFLRVSRKIFGFGCLRYTHVDTNIIISKRKRQAAKLQHCTVYSVEILKLPFARIRWDKLSSLGVLSSPHCW